MMLQVAVNGDRSKADHPAVPVTAEELARDARQCVAAGAHEFHVHVRDGDGNPTLAPGYVDQAVSAMRAAGARAVGVTTVAGIEPGLQRRLSLISRWTRPAYSSVNVCEEGSIEVMRALLAARDRRRGGSVGTRRRPHARGLRPGRLRDPGPRRTRGSSSSRS